jgi:hypothetical protein
VRCRTIFNCTEAWPRAIRITRAICEVKKVILTGSRDIPIRQAPAAQGRSGGGRMNRDRPRGDDAAGPVFMLISECRARSFQRVRGG